MARYKKADVRIWADEKFRRLTPPQPCGQALWWRLMVPREATNIPGIVITGELSLAEHLKWSLPGLRKAWGEIAREKMAIADWSVGLIFLFNGIKYHEPENPNVITSWRAPWDEVPECDVKAVAYVVLRSYIEMLVREKKQKPTFIEAFDKAIPEPLPRPFTKPFIEGLPEGLSELFGKAYGESGAGAVTGAETLSGTGAFPVLQDPYIPVTSSVLETAPNGSEKPDFQKFWGPVEGHLRKEVTDEIFQRFYAGIRVLGMNSSLVVLAVPDALIARNNGLEITETVLRVAIEKSGKDFLRDRGLKVVKLSEVSKFATVGRGL